MRARRGSKSVRRSSFQPSPRTPLPPQLSLYSDFSSIAANIAAGSMCSTARTPTNGAFGTATRGSLERPPGSLETLRGGAAASLAGAAARRGGGELGAVGPRLGKALGLERPRLLGVGQRVHDREALE